MRDSLACAFPALHAGWAHLQFNPTCRPAQAVVAFNARAVGTINLPQNIVALNTVSTYLQQAFKVDKPLTDNGLWVADPKCLEHCKLTWP